MPETECGLAFCKGFATDLIPFGKQWHVPDFYITDPDRGIKLLSPLIRINEDIDTTIPSQCGLQSPHPLAKHFRFHIQQRHTLLHI